MGGDLHGDFGGTFPHRSERIEVEGVGIAYVDEGPREAAPLLMLHGNPTWSYMWRNPIGRLSAAGHRCVAIDHMGFGRSDKPPRPSLYALERHVANLVAVIDRLDLEDATLVAHDWGGPIGLGALLERRERFGALVLLNTWAWELPSFLPPFIRQFRTEGLGEILALAGNLFVESIPGGMARRQVDPTMMEAYRAPFPDYWSRVGTLAFARDLPLSEHDRSAPVMGGVHDGLADLADLPALLIWGTRDRVFQPVFLQQWREILPHAEVLELEAGHYLVEDEPDAVSEAIERFSSSRAARRAA